MTVKRWILVACAAGLLMLIFLFWMAQLAASRESAAHGHWQEKITQTRTLTKDGKLIPSMDLLKNLEDQQENFSQRWNAMLTLLRKSDRFPQYTNALEFKGDLFKIQRALLSQAESLSITIPPDIGFKEFTGKEIPQTGALNTLSFELVKIKEFLELLMECPVAEVKELQRGVSETKPFYRACSFQVRFFCSPQAFEKFLSQLLAPGSLFVLENVDVRLRSENTLEVQGTVQAIGFSE